MSKSIGSRKRGPIFSTLPFVEKIQEYLGENTVIEQLLLLLIVIVVIRALIWSFGKFLGRMTKKGLDHSAVPLISDLFKYSLYIIGLLIGLNIFGVNTNGILAMIGAASLAIGLALKDTLSNVASGILLLFLTPFKAGDYIECGAIKGKIVGIGLFNTTLKTTDGLFVSAPNSSLWGAPIVNFSRNKARRLDLTVGVAYGTSLKIAFDVFRKMISDEDRFLKEPAPEIFVESLADSSVNITIHVWVRASEFLDLKREYLEKIKTVLDESEIEIPFPHRVIHLKQD